MLVQPFTDLLVSTPQQEYRDWQPAEVGRFLQQARSCLQPSVFSFLPQQEYLGVTQGPHPHSLPHLPTDT